MSANFHALYLINIMDLLTSFILGSFSVWRITHLLHAEDGPWDVFVRLRRLLGNGFFGKLTDCFYCLSLWVAAPFAYYLGNDGWIRFLLWWAMSGAAILLQRFSQRHPIFPPNQYEET
jgi:hypothetical protein